MLCGLAGQSRRRLEYASARDIIWRSRAGDAADYLVKILQDPATTAEQHDHYMRAFDFHDGAKKEAALKSLLGL